MRTFRIKIFKVMLAVLAFGAMSISNAEESRIREIKVGATPIPHAQILKFIIPILKQEGVELKVVDFTDYITPNLALADKSLDANFIQHKPFLDKINNDRKLNLINIAKVHIEPIGAYSRKIKSIDELSNGALITVPNDSTNMGRALILLHNNGIIKLKDSGNLHATEFDIIENPKNVRIKPVEAALLSKTLQDASLAIINGNYAMQANLRAKDALIIEDSRSPYANILVVRAGDENKDDIIKLKKALQSKEVRQFIRDTYKGEIVPAF